MPASDTFAGVRTGRCTADLISLAEIENERVSVQLELDRRIKIASDPYQPRLNKLADDYNKLAEKVRQEALEAVADGADPKTLGQGVSHRVTHRPDYDREKVLFWALDSEFEEELVNPPSLKVAVFERMLRNWEFSDDDIHSMRSMGVNVSVTKHPSIAIRVDSGKLLELRDELARRGIDPRTGEIVQGEQESRGMMPEALQQGMKGLADQFGGF